MKGKTTMTIIFKRTTMRNMMRNMLTKPVTKTPILNILTREMMMTITRPMMMDKRLLIRTVATG